MAAQYGRKLTMESVTVNTIHMNCIWLESDKPHRYKYKGGQD